MTWITTTDIIDEIPSNQSTDRTLWMLLYIQQMACLCQTPNKSPIKRETNYEKGRKNKNSPKFVRTWQKNYATDPDHSCDIWLPDGVKKHKALLVQEFAARIDVKSAVEKKVWPRESKENGKSVCTYIGGQGGGGLLRAPGIERVWLSRKLYVEES